MDRRQRICIGIPCFQGVSAETLEDYMRFAFYIGRHYRDYDFFLAIKSKSEQFRARNSIVEAAMQTGCDYLLMLDDDHVIDWAEKAQLEPSALQEPFEFLRKLMDCFSRIIEKKVGIIGALYLMRGGECRPVVMKEGKDGGFFWLRDDEIKGELQEVAVTGGGCMLIDMNLFSVIPFPWFEPELDLGTDIQICKKAREAGYSVWCDTSIVLGHVMAKREVVTPKNRHRIYSESLARGDASKSEGMDPKWMASSALSMYRMDAEEYLGLGFPEMEALAATYQEKYNRFSDFDRTEDYYRNLGVEQLARQVWFHHQPWMVEQMESILSMINHGTTLYGLDFGCGSAPVGFELALRGHRMDFIDLDGAPAYEFTKWRTVRRGVRNVSFSWGGPYDFALFLDSIEHLREWREILGKAIDLLRPDGCLVTNFFLNQDYENVEHVNMDKPAVRDFLVSRGIYPLNQVAWIKRDIAEATRKEMAA